MMLAESWSFGDARATASKLWLGCTIPWQTGQTGGNTVAPKRIDFGYNAWGQFTSITRYKDTDGGTANEVATSTFTYDTLARLTGLAYGKGGTNLFTPYAWSYDSLSSRGFAGGGTSVATDPRVAATAAMPAMPGLGRVTQMTGQDGTSDYGYDKSSQLTSAVHSFQTDESYTYDANGNRTMMGYQTGTDNRLLNDGTYSYEYDQEGNRTKRTNSTTGEVTEYAWDYHNRLTQVIEKDSMGQTTKVVEYTYDVFNRRIAKEVDTTSPFDMADAAIERYVYDDIHNGLVSLDGGNVVLDFSDPDGAGTQPMTLAKRYLYGEMVDQILAQEDVTKNLTATDRVLRPLVDDLGTVRDLAKQDGTIAAHYKYDAYGSVTSGDTSLTRYLFTSRELDTDTGLQYNRARWYDPVIGRWIREDPMGFMAGDANVGRYVGNGTTGRFDPSGLQDNDAPPDWRRYGQYSYWQEAETAYWTELLRESKQKTGKSMRDAVIESWHKHGQEIMFRDRVARSYFQQRLDGQPQIGGTSGHLFFHTREDADMYYTELQLQKINPWLLGLATFFLPSDVNPHQTNLDVWSMMVGGFAPQAIPEPLRSAPPREVTIPARPFTERLADYNQNPGAWTQHSIHVEPATSIRARRGISEQIIYRNSQTDEVLYRHRVIDARGRVLDDHFRPNYKARVGDVDQ